MKASPIKVIRNAAVVTMLMAILFEGLRIFLGSPTLHRLSVINAIAEVAIAMIPLSAASLMMVFDWASSKRKHR